MKFPAHWARATVADRDRGGKAVSFTCWRSSDASAAEARENALAAARRILQIVLAGQPLEHYGYGQTPLREEVLQRFTNDTGELIAAITVNAWGALVLNTAQVMFVDIDFPPVSLGELVRHMFARLFRKNERSLEQKREDAVRSRLERYFTERPEFGARIYRTFGGMRLLVTHALFDPRSDTSQAVLGAIGADPLYRKLCTNQESFRARLTPKPWRCGHAKNTTRWPRETPEAQQAYAAWRARYAERQSKFCTCRYLGTLGNGHAHPDAERIIAVHDDVSRAGESLALA
jgi:hypothetical protein